MDLKLLPLKDTVLEAHGVPFKAKTLYTWRCRGKHPQLFAKVGGRVFLNYDAFQEWIKRSAKETAKLKR